MKVVADASPLIALAKVGEFALLEKLFEHILITSEVHAEVVTMGAGLPGAEETSKASWIEVQRIRSQTNLTGAQRRFALDIGELSTLVLAVEIKAELVLIDYLAAR